ncbi:4-methyl-5(b-hydroxyethyl)-thiazole monophosphate biosynthesis [Marinobacter daqiaonensis]|uniref:4-methyl-5(B-hydroxyethyl)-thiazole monophosphate biosynthesis n=1 Tax=Marinobacter daqiaonensis TaxID=650891 RepID=A0A1I6JFW0_9GAMM|nr:DJ-1 family glyoxalase III [Marinobacter daqiaonensis]SFR77863.1 4-methyl-5(b-hydroxyethyl)-thiazole monophosphate biosynthesis [Marinobacter daqiaonensis]
MNKTALVPIAEGSEDIETVTIIDVLRRAGVEVTVASVHEELTVTASRRTRLVADVLLQDCVDQDYDLIALPGGMPGAKNLSESPLLIDRLRKQRESGFWYAAICAAPAVALAPHGLLDGMAATGHANFREALPDTSQVEQRVVVDGNCITSQGPGSAIEFALELVARVCGRDIRDKVAAPMMLP